MLAPHFIQLLTSSRPAAITRIQGDTVSPVRDLDGDLPPLLSNRGYAWTAFYDTRFGISDIVGRSLIIHENRDDFTTQPAGDSGKKIACGVISVYVGR